MSFRRVWARFLRGPVTLGLAPGVREAWHRGRRWYHVWALRVDDPAVRARRDAVLDALGTLAEPFCADDPHVTLWVHGFETPTFAHPEAGRTFPLRVGGANAFLAAPFLEVRGPLAGLRLVFPGPEERWAAYRPHLTVGRFRRVAPTREVAARLRPWRALPPILTRGTLRHCVVDAFDDRGRLIDVDP